MHSSWYSKVFIALIQYLCIAALATAMNALLKAVAVALGKDKTNAGIYWTRQMRQKEEKKKGGKIFEVHKGWRFCGIPQKNYKLGSHAGNKGNYNGNCQSENLPHLFISMVLETRQSLLTFFVLFPYCPCDNARHNSQENNGNEDESYKSSCEKSLLCFHVVGCRSLFQITIHLILVRDQFETVEIRCVEGDGDKPRV